MVGFLKNSAEVGKKLKKLPQEAKMEIPDFIPGKIEDKYVEIKAKLQEENILKKIDEPAFDIMMFHYGLVVEAMQAIKEKGPFQKDRSILRKNPALQIFRENSRAFEGYAKKLGLFPGLRETMIIDMEFYQGVTQERRERKERHNQ